MKLQKRKEKTKRETNLDKVLKVEDEGLISPAASNFDISSFAKITLAKSLKATMHSLERLEVMPV